MPDRTDSGQGRDALDAEKWEELKREMIPIGLTPSERRAYWNGYDSAARAAVRKAAREMGTRAYVERSDDGFLSIPLLKSHGFENGDIVRITLVEP